MRDPANLCANPGKSEFVQLPDRPPPAAEPTRAAVPDAPGAAPVLSRDALDRVLSTLAARGGSPPKFRYPSAGTLYPVQTYVSVPPGGIDEVPAGAYYHDPDANALVRVSDHPMDVLDAATCKPAALILLVSEPNAIEPVYRDHAGPFCLLEAGYMGELLAEGAEQAGVSLHAALADEAAFSDGALRSCLGLDEGRTLLACWSVRRMGAPPPAAPDEEGMSGPHAATLLVHGCP